MAVTEAGAQAASPAVVTTVQPLGVNFTIHTVADPNFCVESTPAIAGSPISISQCATRDNQHWTFAGATDGSVVLVSGSGTCLGLDKSTSATQGITLGLCAFNGAEKFFYSDSGQLTNKAGTRCLQYAQAAQNAYVFNAKCQSGLSTQTFQLGH